MRKHNSLSLALHSSWALLHNSQGFFSTKSIKSKPLGSLFGAVSCNSLWMFVFYLLFPSDSIVKIQSPTEQRNSDFFDSRSSYCWKSHNRLLLLQKMVVVAQGYSPVTASHVLIQPVFWLSIYLFIVLQCFTI